MMSRYSEVRSRESWAPAASECPYCLGRTERRAETEHPTYHSRPCGSVVSPACCQRVAWRDSEYANESCGAVPHAHHFPTGGIVERTMSDRPRVAKRQRPHSVIVSVVRTDRVS